MTKIEVLDLLKENRDARGEANWKEMGDRNKKLNAAAIKVAKAIGPIHDGDTKCEPMDELKHLTSDDLRNKLGK